MHADLDTDAEPLPTARLDGLYHLGDGLALMHQLGTQAVGAGPALRTAAVDVDAVAIGPDEGSGARELEWRAGGELCY